MQPPGGINSPMSAAGDTLLVPVGLGAKPMVLALVLGATGTIPTATPRRRPTSSASPSPPATPNCGSAPNQVDGILFDTKQLTAAAGARVSLTYTNGSAIPHDWHLFDGPNASAPSIVSTKIEAGPNDVQPCRSRCRRRRSVLLPVRRAPVVNERFLIASQPEGKAEESLSTA